MNWQRYRLLMVGGGICLILIMGAIFFTVRSSGAHRATEGKLNSAVNRLRALRANDPFPSPGNVEKLKQNRDAVQDYLTGFQQELASGQIEPIPMLPTGFNRYFGKIRNGLLDLAGKPSTAEAPEAPDDAAVEETAEREARIQVPAEFAFGFAQYALGIPPRQEHIERLTIQLQTISKLCEDLFSLGIAELNEITRDEFESVRGNLQREYTSGMQFGEAEARGMDLEEEAAKKEAEKNRLYFPERFQFSMTCSEEVAWAVLDRFTHYDLFLVLNAVDIQNANSNAKLQPKFGETRNAGGRSARPQRPVRPAPRTVRPGLEPSPVQAAEREVLAGREHVKLTLDLAVYRFNLTDTASPEEGN